MSTGIALLLVREWTLLVMGYAKAVLIPARNFPGQCKSPSLTARLYVLKITGLEDESKGGGIVCGGFPV